MEYLQRSNQHGVDHFGPWVKFFGAPFGADVGVCRERTSWAK